MPCILHIIWSPSAIYEIPIPSLKLTASLHLTMDAWKLEYKKTPGKDRWLSSRVLVYHIPLQIATKNWGCAIYFR